MTPAQNPGAGDLHAVERLRASANVPGAGFSDKCFHVSVVRISATFGRMDPRAEIALLTGQMAYQVVLERLTDPRPTTLREMPPTPDHLTREWLTLALCDGVPGAEVMSWALSDRDSGTPSRQRLTVTYTDAGAAAGLPVHLFTKSGPTFKTRLVSAANLSRIEANFYAHVRPELDIEAPPTRYSAYDPVNGRQLLLVDDVAQTAGAQFGTVLTRTLTKAQAESVVDTLAALHTRYWKAPLQRRFGT